MAIIQVNCPYCGAQIELPQKISSRSFSFPIKNVGLNLGRTLITHEFSLHCPFCERKYQYVKINNLPDILKLTMKISDSVIEWFKKWGIELENLNKN